MTFQNKSGLPDRDILLILRFIDPEELLYECDVIISNQRDRERSGLFIPFGGKNHGIIFKDGYETEEHLVNTLAHEFWHMHQFFYHFNGIEDRFSDKDVCEEEAEAYAKEMQILWQSWNEGDLDWSTLARYKRSICDKGPTLCKRSRRLLKQYLRNDLMHLDIVAAPPGPADEGFHKLKFP